MGTIKYIRNFLQDPGVASITPTSRFTIDRICGYMDFSRDIRILEFGPADGVFTKVLLSKCSPGSSLIAIETNEDFVESLLKINDKRLMVEYCSAEKSQEIVKSLGWEAVDYIISGIPFSFLKPDAKRNILNQSAALLSLKGTFLGYQTSLHLKPLLEQHFNNVSTEMEFRNIPPMCIYIANKV